MKKNYYACISLPCGTTYVLQNPEDYDGADVFQPEGKMNVAPFAFDTSLEAAKAAKEKFHKFFTNLKHESEAHTNSVEAK